MHNTCSISSLLVHLTYKREVLIFPLVQPAATPSEHNTTFTQSQKPLNSSSGLTLKSFTDLLRLRSPGLPLLSSSVWFSATVLGEMLCNTLTSWRDVTVSKILPMLSQLLHHIKLLPPDKMTSFAVKLKGTPLPKGFQ